MVAYVAPVAALMLLAGPARDGDKALEPFQGKWKIVSIVANGQELPSERFGKGVLEVKGDERVIREGEEVKAKSKFKVDATKSPKTIDIEIIENADELKGKTLKGIYEIKDDLMTVNVTIEGSERPTDFTCKPDSGRLLQKFQKIKDK